MMKRIRWPLASLLFAMCLPAMASTTRSIDADSFKSSDHTQTYSLPAASDTLIGRASSDTLQNKSIGGSLKLNGSSSGYIGLQSPATAFSHTLTFPQGSSSGMLSNDGNGSLSWNNSLAATFRNLLANPNFDTNLTTGWVASAGTLGTTNVSSNLYSGGYSGYWTPNAASDTLINTAWPITAGGGPVGNGGVKCSVKSASNNFTMSVLDGSNVLATQTLTGISSYTPAVLTFIFPASSTGINLKFTSGDTTPIYIDECFLGDGNVVNGTVAISQGVSATVSYSGGAPSADASWVTSVTDNGAGDFTLNHVAQTAAYKCVCAPIQASTAVSCPLISSSSTTQRFKVSTIAGAGVDENAVVTCAPLSSQIAVTPDTSAMSWSGYHDTDCGFAISSTTIADTSSDASCTFTERTNSNFGTVTSYLSGSDKLPGIVFTPKRAAKYYVCASTPVYGSAVDKGVYLELSDLTPIVISSGMNAVERANNQKTIVMCGLYSATSTAAKTIRIRTLVDSGSTAALAGYSVAKTVEWSIIAADQVFPMPVIVNSISTPYNGQAKHTAAQIGGTAYNNVCSASNCAVFNSPGTWINSITINGTGDYTLNFVTGTFPSAAICLTAMGSSSLFGNGSCSMYAQTNTSVSVTCGNLNTASNSFFSVMCDGY